MMNHPEEADQPLVSLTDLQPGQRVFFFGNRNPLDWDNSNRHRKYDLIAGDVIRPPYREGDRSDGMRCIHLGAGPYHLDIKAFHPYSSPKMTIHFTPDHVLTSEGKLLRINFHDFESGCDDDGNITPERLKAKTGKTWKETPDADFYDSRFIVLDS
jgi:hypothetical protein